MSDLVKREDVPAENTDIELWRERAGDFYADSVFVTKAGALGINCGGHVIVKKLRDWHALAAAPSEPAPEVGTDTMANPRGGYSTERPGL